MDSAWHKHNIDQQHYPDLCDRFSPYRSEYTEIGYATHCEWRQLVVFNPKWLALYNADQLALNGRYKKGKHYRYRKELISES